MVDQTLVDKLQVFIDLCSVVLCLYGFLCLDTSLKLSGRYKRLKGPTDALKCMPSLIIW